MIVTSTFCAADYPQCVGVRPVEGGYVAGRGEVGPGVVVSNTQLPDTEVYFDYTEWQAFLEGVKKGQFEPEVLTAILNERNSAHEDAVDRRVEIGDPAEIPEYGDDLTQDAVPT